MYMPTLARFTARDPLPPDGEPVLLEGLPDGVSSIPPSTPFAYAGNSPANYIDPDGMKYGSPSPPRPKPAPTGPTCTVVLECLKLVGKGAFGTAEHCGLRVTTPNNVTTLYHVRDGVCKEVNSRGEFPVISGSYFDVDRFTVDPKICDCITAAAAKLTAANPPYSVVPGNSDCGGPPSCNSNYAAKCLLQHCGLTGSYDRYTFPPAGWNHRMKKCLSPKLGSRGGCFCCKWESTDDAWCSQRTQAEAMADPNG
jgi:hypothetical protein